MPLVASRGVAKEAQVVPVGLHSKYALCESQGRSRQEESVPTIVAAPGHGPAGGNRQLEMLESHRPPIEPGVQVEPGPSRPLVDSEQNASPGSL